MAAELFAAEAFDGAALSAGKWESGVVEDEGGGLFGGGRFEVVDEAKLAGSSASASPQDPRRASGASAPLNCRFATEPHRGDSLRSAESVGASFSAAFWALRSAALARRAAACSAFFWWMGLIR